MIAQKISPPPEIAMANPAMADGGKDMAKWTAFAAIDAARQDGGWSISELCRVSSFDPSAYHRIIKGSRPLTEKALTRLSTGLRSLELRRETEQFTAPRIVEMGPEYHVIPAGMKRRRMELGLTDEQVDYLAGFASGHTAKLENPDNPNGRGYGEVSCRLWCQALGVQIAIVEGPVPLPTLRMANPIGSAELSRRYDANRKRLEAKRATLERKRRA